MSDELIAELPAADTVVIGAPMYNFGVTTGLRAWFDHVLRAGETFSYSESGPQGLLPGKRVIVIGAGETGELTARALTEQGVRSVFVANRRYDRAIGLAQRFGGRAIRERV